MKIPAFSSTSIFTSENFHAWSVVCLLVDPDAFREKSGCEVTGLAQYALKFA
jgi:hypothetical protein